MTERFRYPSPKELSRGLVIGNVILWMNQFSKSYPGGCSYIQSVYLPITESGSGVWDGRPPTNKQIRFYNGKILVRWWEQLGLVQTHLLSVSHLSLVTQTTLWVRHRLDTHSLLRLHPHQQEDGELMGHDRKQQEGIAGYYGTFDSMILCNIALASVIWNKHTFDFINIDCEMDF